MVRKSDRNKSSTAEKTRKRRGTRRSRKDSSTDSEPEPNPPSQEENISAIALPRDSKIEEAEEAESSSSGSRLRNRKGAKKNATAKDSTSQEEQAPSVSADWNEDVSFWTGDASSTAVSTADVNEDEGSTWKIQSSNGSGGEIQKLKICRQRPTDSTGSSSPAKECASPRVKRMLVTEKIDGENAELELDAPMDIVDVENEKCETNPVIVQKVDVENENCETNPVIAQPVESELTETPADIAPIEKEVIDEEIVIPGLDLVGEGQQKQDQLWISAADSITEVSMIAMPPTKEDEVEGHNSPTKNVGSSEDLPTDILPIEAPDVPEVKEIEAADEISNIPSEMTDFNINEVVMNEEVVVQEEMIIEESDNLEQISNIESTVAAVETSSSLVDDASTPVAEVSTPIAESSTPVEESSTPVEEATSPTEVNEAITPTEESVSPAAEESTTPIIESSTETTTATSTTGVVSNTSANSKCLAGTALAVSTELAMEQIAKKLNERAARGKETVDDKEKTSKSVHSRENSPDLDRSIEEGEIVSSAAATPDPQQPSSKSTKTTVIMKPKEVICLPTKLKRIIEKKPQEERKRRVSKQLCFSSQISITSDLLKVLAPDARPVPPEEIDFISKIKEEDTGKNDIEVKKSVPIMNKFDHKMDVEVTISNDVREVKKKKPIVIDSKTTIKTEKSPPGPKLPSQENHKAIRKISIVSADGKAGRKSPSPSKKKATEVLFITNLVRPFTVPQLRELLARTGTIAPNGFYIDKIKSKCYVKYTDLEMAIETRHALHGVRWPVNNPKTLRVEFAAPEDMAVVQKLADEEAGALKKQEADAAPSAITGVTGIGSASGGWLNLQTALKPSRRVTTTVREWDMGKIVGGETAVTKTSPPEVEVKKKTEEEWSRKKEKSTTRADKDRDRRRAHSPEPKAEPPKKIKKKEADAPAKLLDDLFRKTKATPCIYWLPLTAAQIAVKEEMRRQHMAEHERRLAELRKTDTSSRRDTKDRDRDRDRDRRKK